MYQTIERVVHGEVQAVTESRCHLEANATSFSERSEAAVLEWQRFRIEKICCILRTIPNKEVGADIGCMGGMATPFYAATGIKILHGYDISDVLLDRLRTRGFEGFYWNVDGGKCPMPDNSYDVIIAGEIIEHIVDTDSFAEELHRILKVGGHLILSTPNLASWYNRIRLFRGLPPRCYPGTSSTIRQDPLIDNNHIRVNVLSEWVHFLECHGFRVKEIHGSSHLQVLQGGLRARLLKFVDRLACGRPSLAVNVILVASRV